MEVNEVGLQYNIDMLLCTQILRENKKKYLYLIFLNEIVSLYTL